jgi:hypothetical protein
LVFGCSTPHSGQGIVSSGSVALQKGQFFRLFPDIRGTFFPQAGHSIGLDNVAGLKHILQTPPTIFIWYLMQIILFKILDYLSLDIAPKINPKAVIGSRNQDVQLPLGFISFRQKDI